jgi:hypothetical protein
MSIEQRLVKLLGEKDAAKLWSRIKYWRQEQQWEKWRQIKESISKNKRV